MTGDRSIKELVWPLSVPLKGLEVAHFDVVIVGSGYGGSIAASRLAAMGKSVCILERGREISPGSYPKDLEGARREVEMVTARRGALSPDANAMMQVRVNDDVHVILGNGLGGGSLVNAGVSIMPDMRVFLEGWPAVYKPSAQEAGSNLQTNVLSKLFEKVKKNLGATQLPSEYTLPKLTALEQSAKAMKQDFDRADINVTFTDGPNEFGYIQQACNMCGDCCSGCNYSAKNTLLMNYLPHAHDMGAKIVTEAEVSTLVPTKQGWCLNVLDRSAPVSGQKTTEISADMVILAAGSLGSTEILSRSTRAKNGPSLSKALGTKFSTNGDVLAFGFGANLLGSNGSDDNPTPLYSIGAGPHTPNEPKYRPGPCITGVVRVDMDESNPLEYGMLIEDGTAPGPFASIYPPALFLQDVLTASFSDFPDATTRLEALSTLGAALQSGTDPASLCYSGVMTQMQSYLVMSHDNAQGTLEYNQDTQQVYVDWPNAGCAPVYLRDNDRLKQASDAIWANFIANPIWQEGFGRNLVSVHPLGGCPMSDSEKTGVTDADCRVYTGDGKNGVYENLMVCDGSVIPRSLGVNPLLTISAITERAMDQLLLRDKSKSRPPPQKKAATASVKKPIPDNTTTKAVDYEAIAMGIGAAAVMADEIAAFSKKASNSDDTFKNNTMGVALIEAFLAGIVPNYNLADLTSFTGRFFFSAKQWGDLEKGFGKISTDLRQLFTSISTSQTDESLQPFLDAFFEIVGDVSPFVRFEETMQGFVSDRRLPQDNSVSDPYQIAEELGRASGHALRADFKINAQHTLGKDADNTIIAQIKNADLKGDVLIGAGEAKVAYTVKNGTFDLLQPDPDRIETWLMTYRCELWTDEATAATWSMTGTKVLRRSDPDSFWWKDLTTLYVDLEPVGAEAPTAAQQGIIRLDLQDLAAQLSTVSTGFEAPITVDALEQEAIAATPDGKFADKQLLRKAFLELMSAKSNDDTWVSELARGLQEYFGAGIAGIFGKLVFRAYGGYAAYMNDFPSLSDGRVKVLPEPGCDKVHGSLCESISVSNNHGGKIQLFHFAPPDPKTAKGPIVLAPGMSTTSLSFALLTIDKSLVQRLLEDNYDVWLFDSRLSPRVTPVETDYTLDDVAAEDWPAAVEYVLKNTPVEGPNKATLQVLGHCVGGLTAQMALLGGHVKTEKIRQMMVLQFTVHPAANWFNIAKSESGLANDFSDGFPPLIAGLIHSLTGDGEEWDELKNLVTKGIPKINPVSSKPNSEAYKKQLGMLHNTVDWNVPFGIDHLCYSPTCHRIYGLYGPVIAHKNLNEATHNGMRQMFGEIATKPFEQLGLIMERGQAVSAEGEDIYLPNFKRLKIPFHVVSGSVNQIVQPESGFHTIQWLKNCMPESADLFTRTLVKGYAHNDCFIGKHSNADVFDGIMNVLNAHGDG